MARPTDQDELLVQAKTDWRKAYNHWRRWRTDAKEEYDLVAGNQWDIEDKMFLERQNRPVVSFNRIAPMLDAVAGSEVQNRQETQYIPRELGDVKVNEGFTAAAKYFRDLCDAEDEESSAFYDCLVCGVGWTETRLDYDDNPDGTITIERVDPFEVFVDPASKRGNFADARFLFRVKDLTRQEVIDEWGEGVLGTLMPTSFSWGDDKNDEDDPHETIHGRQYELGKQKPAENRRRKYRVVEYQWKEWAPVYRMVDPQTGAEVTFSADRWQKLQKAYKRTIGQDLPPNSFGAVKQRRLEIRRAFFLGELLLEEGPAPCPTAFTYRAITGRHDRNHGMWYGLTRAMKDPQKWANKFYSQILHIINANAKGGLLVETDAVDNLRDFETRWAEADSIAYLRPGGTGKVQPKPLAAVPPDVTNMMGYAVQSLRDVTGINLELLGMAEQVQPGVLEYQRRQSGLTILATLFNSLRRYRKEQGRLMLYFIQEYIPEGTLIRIEGNLGAQYVPLMKVPDTTQFDVVVDEAPSSPNLKEQVFGVLQVIAPQLMALGVKIPLEALNYLPLPDSLVQSIQQENQVPPGGQPPTDPATQAIQAQIAVEQQKAQADMSLGQTKLQNESQLKMQQLMSDHEIATKRLQLDRERFDLEGQLEQLKLQAMLMKIIPGATNEVQESTEQLAQTVAQNHADVQNAFGALVKHVQGLADRQNGHGELLKQLALPREIVRDEYGRVSGTRIANGKANGMMGTD